MTAFLLLLPFFGQTPPPPEYRDHFDLLHYVDALGRRQEVATPADWARRVEHVRRHMQRVMGPSPGENRPQAPLPIPFHQTKVGKVTRRQLFVPGILPGSEPMRAILLLPEFTDKKRRPAILALHQTTKKRADEPAGLAGDPSMHYALHLAERGFIVIAPDYPSMGGHSFDFVGKHGFVSGTMKAIWDNVRMIDYLQSLPEVDPDRIGSIGHSLGGHNALFTAAFDPRLKVVVSSCGFTTFARDDMPSWSGPTYMPRIAKEFGNDFRKVPFDFPEIVASLAPRPFLASAAEKDDDFNVEGVKECLVVARKVYALFGKADSLEGYYPKTGHAFPADARERAYSFLERHLKAK